MAYNSLPDVFEFNDTTIPEVFSGNLPTVFIFLGSLDHPVYEEFKQAALSMKGKVNFTYSLMDTVLASQMGDYLGVTNFGTKDINPEIFIFAAGKSQFDAKKFKLEADSS
jgi:hypothetical protein